MIKEIGYVRSILMLSIIIGLIFVVGIVVLDEFGEIKREINCENPAIIEDIIQISAGGFMKSTRCILQTDKGKKSFDDFNCHKQIGDAACLRDGS